MKIQNCFFPFFLCFLLIGKMQGADFRFNTHGKFKIVQVTDTHIQANSEHSQVTITMLRQVLDAEKPDLVVFTGDNVVQKPYKAGFDMLIEPVISRKIPWVLVFGNHDDEQDLTREQLAGLIEPYPYQSGKMGKIKNVTGYGNFVLEIKGANDKKPKALIYGMDSRAYSTLKPTVDGYGWFAPDQIKWYQEQSSRYTARNGNMPLPALAFFHIPLPEYKEVEKPENKVIGDKKEKVCSPDINSGMFLSMLEQGDVMGTFVGHDHINNYIFNCYGIALAYGQFSGSKTTYGDQNGVRVIELTEGFRGFDTWIRYDATIVIDKVKFPDDLPIEKPKKK